MKKLYQQPYVKVFESSNEDILTASITWTDGKDFGRDDPYGDFVN